MPESNNIKKWQIVSICIACGAFLLSIGVLIVSIKSCDLSQESIKHSKDTFIAANRPYLILKPIKDVSTNTFIQSSIKGYEVELKTRYLIRNAGNTPAIDISSPVFRLLGDTPLAKNPHIETMPVIALGPGEEENIVVTFLLGSKSGNKDYAQKLNEGVESGKAGLLLDIELSYSSNFPSIEPYRYQVKHKISINEAKILSKSYK